ncbi:MAG: hypothetical protein AABZ62_03805 [Planctomycetota bacterium]
MAITEDEGLEIRNFGRTTLIEVKKKLAQLGLDFGMRKKEKVGTHEA